MRIASRICVGERRPSPSFCAISSSREDALGVGCPPRGEQCRPLRGRGHPRHLRVVARAPRRDRRSAARAAGARVHDTYHGRSCSSSAAWSAVSSSASSRPSGVIPVLAERARRAGRRPRRGSRSSPRRSRSPSRSPVRRSAGDPVARRRSRVPRRRARCPPPRRRRRRRGRRRRHDCARATFRADGPRRLRASAPAGAEHPADDAVQDRLRRLRAQHLLDRRLLRSRAVVRRRARRSS